MDKILNFIAIGILVIVGLSLLSYVGHFLYMLPTIYKWKFIIMVTVFTLLIWAIFRCAKL